MESTLTPDKALRYMLAGQATVGFHSEKTGNDFWFYIKLPYPQKFVNANTNQWKVYLHYSVKEVDKYIGTIRRTPGTDHYAFQMPLDTKAWSPLKKEYAAAFEYSFHAILNDTVPKQLIIRHRGQCGYCGRPLTDPLSIERGIGPTCYKRMGYE